MRVCRLVSDKNPVPMVLEMMLEHVEMHGLYTEGIYRKSGSANRMKELHQRLETGQNPSGNTSGRSTGRSFLFRVNDFFFDLQTHTWCAWKIIPSTQ